MPTKLSLRAKVSWASSTTNGATGNGVYGTPQIVIKSTLKPGPKLRYTIAHEVGHLFQRQYTTNLSLSWLDEAVAEWAAYQTVGADFPTSAVQAGQGSHGGRGHAGGQLEAQAGDRPHHGAGKHQQRDGAGDHRGWGPHQRRHRGCDEVEGTRPPRVHSMT